MLCFKKINALNFDSILKESINRIQEASVLRILDDEEVDLLSEFDLAKCLGLSCSYDNVSLRRFLEIYCYGTSTLNK